MGQDKFKQPIQAIQNSRYTGEHIASLKAQLHNRDRQLSIHLQTAQNDKFLKKFHRSVIMQ
jgi:hypothetical protein